MPLHRVRVVWTGVDGAPAYSNFYFDTSLASAAVAHAAVAAWCNALKGLVTNLVQMNVESDVSTVREADNVLIGVETVPSATFNGGAAGNRIPSATQGVIRLLTGAYAGGRQIRGRIYVPYTVTSNVSTTGDPAGTYITTLNTANTALIAAVPAGAYRVYSRLNGASYAVSSMSVWNKFGVMRSRRD